jgi:lactose/L-arabinose transport system permease protein
MIVRNFKKSFKYIFLSLAAFISIFPFFWMISGATNTSADITQGKLGFGTHLAENIKGLFDETRETEVVTEMVDGKEVDVMTEREVTETVRINTVDGEDYRISEWFDADGNKYAAGVVKMRQNPGDEPQSIMQVDTEGLDAEFFVMVPKTREVRTLWTYFKNSAIIALVGMLFQLLVASMAGYGFEVFRNRVSEKIYTLLLLTMMVPFAALMIPLFKLVGSFGLMGTYVAVIVPLISAPFMIFFFRQSTKSFPQELLQAARVDGLNEWQAFFRIYMPTMKSTYSAAAILSFMTLWNNYLWPLIVIGPIEEKQTIILKISAMTSGYTPDYGVIMVAIIMATTPSILIFFLLQKHFVAGMLGSIK